MKKTSMKQRTLYSVRYYQPNHVIGTAVGYKCRLVPRRVAQRIARRLRRNGLDVQIAPLAVRLTQQQADHLERRYA